MTEQKRRYALVVQKQWIEVTEEVYRTYYKLAERERYLDKLAEKKTYLSKPAVKTVFRLTTGYPFQKNP